MSRDIETGANVGIDLVHNRVHEKQLVYTNKIGIAIANNATLDLYIDADSAGAEFETHLRWLIDAEGKIGITLKKASVAPTSPTGPVTTFIRKYQRDATAAAKTKLYTAVTGGTWGTVAEEFVPAGEFPRVVGGRGGPNQEYILEEGKWYHLEMKNLSGAAIDIGIQIGWYELNDKADPGDDPRNTALDAL